MGVDAPTGEGAFLAPPRGDPARLAANDDCRRLVASSEDQVIACATASGAHGTATVTVTSEAHSDIVSVWTRTGSRATQTLTAVLPGTGDTVVSVWSSDVMRDGDVKLVVLQAVRNRPAGVIGADVVGNDGSLLFHLATGARGGNVTVGRSGGLTVWSVGAAGATRRSVRYSNGRWASMTPQTVPSRSVPDVAGQGLDPGERFD